MKYRSRQSAVATRAREAVATDDASGAKPSTYSVTVAERGRIVLPADVRERLGIHEGDRLSVVVDGDGCIRMQTAAGSARSLLGLFKHLSPGGRGVDKLLAERRREAQMEERDTRDLLRARRRRTRSK